MEWGLNSAGFSTDFSAKIIQQRKKSTVVLLVVLLSLLISKTDLPGIERFGLVL